MAENPILFSSFCNLLEKISKTKKRLEIQSYLAEYFKLLKSNEEGLVAACYLCTATIHPDFMGKELGIGETTIVKIVAEVTNKKLKMIRDEFRKEGDLGTIVFKNKAKSLFTAVANFTIIDVLKNLREIADDIGAQSLKGKTNKMLKMISKSSNLEAKYLIRLYEGRMKTGLAFKTVLICLGLVFGNEKDLVDDVKYAYNQCPIFEKIIIALIKFKSNILEHVKIEPGIPVKPMLAQPSKNLTAAFNRVNGEDFVCEFKYDGERAQIHKFDNKYMIFSRNSEDLTPKYPDLQNTITKICRDDGNFVLDCEIVAYDVTEDRILPFQILTTRKRKDVKLEHIKVKVCIYAFDCLFFGEKSLLDEPLKSRKQVIANNFTEINGQFKLIDSVVCASSEEIETIFNDSISKNCEGLMIKSLNSLYKPSMRSTSWVKLKKDYLDGMADSLDLVVIGAYYGKGKRTGAYGGYLLACYNEEEDKYEAICKIGTGFNDETLAKIFNDFKEYVVDNSEKMPQDFQISENIKPDVWLLPKFVWEVKAAGFSLSPIYSAAKNLNKQGISLRFPRFIRHRDDKEPKDATTSEQINTMFIEFNKDEEVSDEFN
ncbi:DNA ligase I, ATP-dependent (dnl1) [Edhazardia aedis USNM 41457]|uniref:DNA ligase n=1 Tax=Edhazardia aedis (strain USNM 41457) TaxID=1003232 RepID=J9DBL0_EDHAE|nr:DNA ligase I, ATP-dependent (dnl1) [Edhazardia aedis USNM 41457]|eukprot:EJW04879.1 DNA ligase I, ATP-dependent (dnl1) [Edhazardia aedis USNM 41457]